MIPSTSSLEDLRLAEEAARKPDANWKRWGPYLSERQWSTVREDYSPGGTSWDYFPHDHARSRAYRWGEDGLLGFSDRQCRLCFALALWNGQDPILKERLFGLTGPEGNHGEDVKECYYYLDSIPTHSYAKALYKYPQAAFPYQRLIDENQKRGLHADEFELTDTGIFDQNRYFDILIEYAKAAPEDLCIRISITNHGPESAPLHLLPTVWFRNTWSWEKNPVRPSIRVLQEGTYLASHPQLGDYQFSFDPGFTRNLFTENETNTQRLFQHPNSSPFVKDAFHRFLIEGEDDAINPKLTGTKAAPLYQLNLQPGQSVTVNLRLTAAASLPTILSASPAESVFRQRLAEADEFYSARFRPEMDATATTISRQAYAGLLWTKQFYHYVIRDWLDGDPGQKPPPAQRRVGRNHSWTHLHCHDILSMPDKWEYPWFAAWDLAFHMLPMAEIDPHFAKDQLVLFLREWYLHPNGQIPAYEFAFEDVNPPVHAWAVWRVYKISATAGNRDRPFLESCFQKLLLNFTWWVNRKDAEGNNLFQGGFLGLDNIGVFDRSKPLPTGGYLQQADGTAWMAFYCLTMLAIALELAQENPVYEDLASKFFEHFVQIADAINHHGESGLWDENDGFYYDQLRLDDKIIPLQTRSLVGLLPLVAVEILEEDKLKRLPDFTKRMHWFMENRPELVSSITFCESCVGQNDRLLSIPSSERLKRALRYLLDEEEFLSPYGIRSLSRTHLKNPYVYPFDGKEYRVTYTPAESDSHLFGGNSNWRGPIWFPVNYLLIEALERYHHFYGDQLQIEYPTGSGQLKNLGQVARDISTRHARIFLPRPDASRPCHGEDPRYRDDPAWKDLVLFYEYFHGDNGRGCGASHQTGWTALVVRCLYDAAAPPSHT
ncbi:MAG: glucosidase [Puniceicoccaceae bacterium]